MAAVCFGKFRFAAIVFASIATQYAAPAGADAALAGDWVAEEIAAVTLACKRTSGIINLMPYKITHALQLGQS